MSYAIEDYNRRFIYITDGFRNIFVPKFRLDMEVNEPYLTLTWNIPEIGGNNRVLKLDYRDVSNYGYSSNPTSAADLQSIIEEYIDSAWTNINTGDILSAKGDLLSHNGITDTILPVGSNESFLGVDNSQATAHRYYTAASVFDLSGYKRMFSQCFYGDTATNLQLTNQANAEAFLSAVARDITLIDLTTYSQVRLVTRVLTGSASANSPRLRLRYKTTFSTTVGDYIDIGTSEVSTSLTSTGVISSGWVDITALAKADVYVTVTQIGGDGAADPVIGFINAYFR